MDFGWHLLREADLDAIERGVLSGEACGGPYHLEIHPTNRCNVKCFFCFTDYYRSGQALGWEILNRVMTEAAAGGLRCVRLSGGGDPLVYPHLIPLWNRLGELGVQIANLTTNGVLLSPHLKALANVGVSNIFISLNEPDETLYARTMQVLPRLFHKVIDGARAAVEMRDGMPPDARPCIELQFLIGSHNADRISEMAALGRELNVDEILIKEMSDVDASRKVAPDQFDQVRSQLRDCLAEDIQSGRNRLRLDFGQHAELQDYVYQTCREWIGDEEIARRENFNPASPRTEYCLMGWHSATVAATGKVYPCCVLHEREGKEMGDVNVQSIHEIWHGDAYRNFRRQFRKVMLTRGDIAYDAKCMGCMDPMCIGRYDCFYTFKMATPDFYRRLAGGLNAQRLDRLLARAGAGMMEAKRKLLSAARGEGD